MTNPEVPIPEPPPPAQRFVRYVLGFGVSVAIGLAPFLGKLKVSLFEPLLNILPPAEHSVAIPLSAALMGVVAVGVQWYSYEKLKRPRLRRLFGRVLAATVVALLAFFVVNACVVARVPVARGETATLLHGFGSPKCAECRGMSDVDCLKVISFDPGHVESCWGSGQMRLSRVLLVLSYIASTVMFGVLVGFLVVGTTEPRRKA